LVQKKPPRLMSERFLNGLLGVDAASAHSLSGPLLPPGPDGVPDYKSR